MYRQSGSFGQDIEVKMNAPNQPKAGTLVLLIGGILFVFGPSLQTSQIQKLSFRIN
jgi:hypothetical protein